MFGIFNGDIVHIVLNNILILFKGFTFIQILAIQFYFHQVMIKLSVFLIFQVKNV